MVQRQPSSAFDFGAILAYRSLQGVDFCLAAFVKLILPCGGSNPPAPASYYVLDITYIIVFLGSQFCREFAGVTGLVFKAIRGRDGCTRDFGRGRYENLSGAISWLTFLAGGAADVRRCRSDWRRELAESTICSLG